jgi:hypothetical protein
MSRAISEQIVKECKEYIEKKDMEGIKIYYLEIMESEMTAKVDWTYVFHRVYLHSCLKGVEGISSWLEKDVYKKLEGIEQIGLRHIFGYGRHLLRRVVR